MYADEVAMDFPNLVMVLTHTGYPYIEEWISMIWRHPNVYGNIGAYYPSSLHPPTVEFMNGPIGRAKVFWATNGFGFTRCKDEFVEMLDSRTRTRSASSATTPWRSSSSRSGSGGTQGRFGVQLRTALHFGPDQPPVKRRLRS